MADDKGVNEKASRAFALGTVTIFCSPLWAGGIWGIVGALRNGSGEIPYLPLILGTLFILLGIAPIVATAVAIQAEPERKAMYEQVRAIPAAWKPEWNAARLPDGSEATGSVINGVNLALTGASLLCGLLAYGTVQQGQLLAGLFLLVAPLFFVGFLIANIRSNMRRQRFGKSELALEESPARIGETMRGAIVVQKLRPEEFAQRTFEIRVSSIRRRTWTEVERGHKRTRTSDTVLWTGSREVPGAAVHFANDGVAIPVALEIPADQQATNDALKNDVVYWQLEASASLPGIDYYSRFEFPVFVR